MNKLRYALVTALAVAFLGAAPAHTLPQDVTARECIAGGGSIVIEVVGEESQSLTARCVGGIHDGRTIG